MKNALIPGLAVSGDFFLVLMISILLAVLKPLLGNMMLFFLGFLSKS